MDTSTARPHLLVVGFDGVRYDTLTAANTPAVDAVAAKGVLLPVPVDARNPTISGPVWSTLATGVYSDKHGVRGNSSRPPQREHYPDFLQVLREHEPGAQTFVAASWPPIVTAEGPGPIFGAPGWHPGVDRHAQEDVAAATQEADDAVLGYALGQLGSQDLRAAFVYFGEPDEFGHWWGTDAGYTSAVERCDRRLAELLAAIEDRPTRAEEAWTVVILTDHGHLDGGGHGGDSDLERTAWIAVAGAGIGAHVRQLCHADVAAHAAQMFDLDLPVDGVAFGLR